MVNKFDFTSIMYPFNEKNALKINVNGTPSDECIKYINQFQLEQAEIVMPDLYFLEKCPSLKFLKIAPSYNAKEYFDFSPLYKMKEIKSLSCKNQYGDRMQYIANIDYAMIRGLEDLTVSVNKGAKNFEKIETLKSLQIGDFKGKKQDVSDLFCSKELDTLQLTSCKIHSLKGIERSKRLQCLYLYYNRSLSDISALVNVKDTLKALRIQNCSKITDFSVIGYLENLELLELSGNNTLPNLEFLKNLKKLKTFEFDMNVLDGNLSVCLNLPNVYCHKNRKHYNLKDKDLPKGKYICGNENIEKWRRLE